MARMRPEDIEVLEKPTAGKKKIFRSLYDAARPDRDFIALYEPTIGSSGDFTHRGGVHAALSRPGEHPT